MPNNQPKPPVQNPNLSSISNKVLLAEMSKRNVKLVQPQISTKQISPQVIAAGMKIAEKVAPHLKKAVKKRLKHKSGDSKFVKGLKSAGSFLLDMLPFGAAKATAQTNLKMLHAPTRASSGLPPLVSNSVPAAYTSLNNHVGLLDEVAIHDRGRIVGKTQTYLVPVGQLVVDPVVCKKKQTFGNVTLDVTQEGQMLFECDLNPAGPVFNSTALGKEARRYEKFHVIDCIAIYEPAIGTTATGAIGMFIDSDPADDFNYQGGFESVQQAAAHEFYEQAPMWMMATTKMPMGGNLKEFFSDSKGTDIRWVSPGKFRALAAVQVPAGSYGTFFIAYKLKFMNQQLDDSNLDTGAFAKITDAAGTQTAANIWGPEDPLIDNVSMGVDAEWDGVRWKFCNIPPGRYYSSLKVVGTVLDDNAATLDGDNYVQVASVTQIQNSAATISSLDMIFDVAQLAPTSADGYIYYDMTSATTVTGATLYMMKIPYGITKPLGDLQSFEKETILNQKKMEDKVAKMEDIIGKLVKTLSDDDKVSTSVGVNLTQLNSDILALREHTNPYYVQGSLDCDLPGGGRMMAPGRVRLAPSVVDDARKSVETTTPILSRKIPLVKSVNVQKESNDVREALKVTKQDPTSSMSTAEMLGKRKKQKGDVVAKSVNHVSGETQALMSQLIAIGQKLKSKEEELIKLAKIEEEELKDMGFDGLVLNE